MTDDSRGADGLFRKGRSGNPETRFKTGDPANPCKRQKRERDARGKTPGAKQELRREEIRAELVALDVLERFLSKTRQTTAPRLPRLPHGPNARREADRLAARSLTRSLRSMQRIARDPDETPEVRVEVARILLERGGARTEGGRADAATGKAEAKPKVIVVTNTVPRSPWKLAAQRNAVHGTVGTTPPLPSAAAPDTPARPEPLDPRTETFARRLQAPAFPAQQVAESEE